MEADKDPYVPHSMVLMGGPIDTRINSNAVNKLAEDRGIEWFRNHVITKVPFPHPGFMRDVYPGFLQLHGFMSMNLTATSRRTAICSRIWSRATAIRRRSTANSTTNISRSWISRRVLSADVDTVFIRHALPKGEMTHRGAASIPRRSSASRC